MPDGGAQSSGRSGLLCLRISLALPLQRIHQYYDFIGGVSVREELLMPALPRALAFRLQMFKKRDRAPRHRPATTHRRLLRGTARV